MNFNIIEFLLHMFQTCFILLFISIVINGDTYIRKKVMASTDILYSSTKSLYFTFFPCQYAYGIDFQISGIGTIFES